MKPSSSFPSLPSTLAFGAASALLLLATQSWATDYTFSKGATPNYTDTSNWSPAGVPPGGPGSTDKVIFGPTTATTMALNASPTVAGWDSIFDLASGQNTVQTTTTARLLTITGTLTKGGTGALSFNGNVSSGGSTLGVSIGTIVQNGTGALVFGNSSNRITSFQAGTMILNASGGSTAISGANGGSGTIGSLTMAVNSNLVFNNAAASGDTYTINIGQLNSSSGTIKVNNGSISGAAVIGTVNLTGTGADSFGGAMLDGASGNKLNLTKSGSGIQTFTSGGNTYTGKTTISAGTLILDGSGNITATSAFEMGVTDSSNGKLTVNSTAFTNFNKGLVLDLNTVSLNNGSWTLFDGSEFGAGDLNLASVTSNLDGLIFTNNSGIWSGTDGAGRTWAFSQDAGTLTVVPEPTTWMLLALGLFFTVARGQRRLIS